MEERIINEVQKVRIAKGDTQEEVAVKVGVSRQTIIAIEKGNYTPSVLLALKLSRYFNVPTDKLFKLNK